MLTIYKASAGSGKTHKLTGEYIQLLFKSPDSYQHILAVTFTNKATDEMKSRIMEELFHLGSGAKSDYMSDLVKQTGMSEEAIKKQGQKILVSILHDYSYFSISTIDRFFQQTIRAFTREIGLQGGYSIEMDTEAVLTEATDRLLLALDQPDNSELMKWMIRFAEEKIEEGGGWNLRRDILKLGREVFKEKYKAFGNALSERLSDKKVLANYVRTLNTIIRETEAELKRLGEEGMNLIKSHGLEPTDFKGGSRSSLLLFAQWEAGIMKPPTATFANLVDNIDNWYTKKTSPEIVNAITSAFEGGLNRQAEAVCQFFSHLTRYNTAREIVRFYHTLGILSDLSRYVAEWREETNKMLIADTTELLNKVIDGSEVPFIYEKTGTRIGHYMIDEFQDTSRMQWENFLPLLRESLAYRNQNLIVGDVKQSIYRFRNSDWTLLSEQVANDFDPTQLQKETLTVNWRSHKQVVDFNNAFFQTAPALLQANLNSQLEESSLSEKSRESLTHIITHAYSESEQLVAPPLQSKDGHVQIRFIPEEEQKAQDVALALLPETIETLQKNGYRAKDIAILVRRNIEGARVADALLAYKKAHPDSPYVYDIISDDSLFTSSSASVRFLVSVFRHLDRPKEDSFKQIALANLLVLSGIEQAIDLETFEKKIHSLNRYSLYETAQSAYNAFAHFFPASDEAYVQSFMDMCSEFSPHATASLSNFLRWWDDSGRRATLVTPDSQDAIRILTIHKSKGLGFKAVIIPFVDWELEHSAWNSPILWCSTDEAPFSELPLVPVQYSSKLADSLFAEDYFAEKMQTYMDHMNTLYVAFTRAKEELIVYAPIGKPDSIKQMNELLLTTIQQNAALNSQLQELEDGQMLFEAGSWWTTTPGKQTTETQQQIHVPKPQASPDKLHMRLHKTGGFFNDEIKKYGILMHDILSGIKTLPDIAGSVHQRYLTGEINQEEKDILIERLHRLTDDETVKEWFADDAEIINEASILTSSGRTYRPDRIILKGQAVTIVDYKFGEVQDDRYPSQIRRYIRLIRQMGYEQVRGFLWYAGLGIIEEVTL